jgi:putative DNA primase/helicase
MAFASSSADTRAYLEALFGQKPAGAFVLIWTLKKGPPEVKRSAWFTDLDAAIAYAAGIADRHVYAGMSVTLEDRGPYLRYEHAHAAGIGGLWLDLDVLSPAHKQRALPPTQADALALLGEAFPFPPTMTVDTGHGVQPYYLFKEFLTLEDGHARARARSLCDRFQDTVIARAEARGWVIEGTSDLPRVLRVPGTFNVKPELPPVPVRILSLDDAARYDPGDVEPFLLDPALTAELDEVDEGHEPPAEPRAIGYSVRAFVLNGAAVGNQRPMICRLARSYWAAHKTAEEAGADAWRAVEASEQRPDDPWTEAVVRRVVRDVFKRKPSRRYEVFGTVKLRGKPVGANGRGARTGPRRLPPLRRPVGVPLPAPARPVGVLLAGARS